MRLAGLCLGLAATILPGVAAGAAVECTLTSTPGSPSASAGGFGDDLSFAATGRAECLQDGAPTSATVCVAARRDTVSGSSGFRRSGRTIDYTLTINSVAVGDADTQVFAGSIPSAGVDLAIEYDVSAADYAGVAGGSYSASFTWTIYVDPGVCN